MDCESGRTFLVVGTVYGHGYGGVVVFKAREVFSPYFAGADVAIVYLAGEVEVDFFYVAGKDGCAGADSYVEELWMGVRGVLSEFLTRCTYFLRRLLVWVFCDSK